VHTAWLTKTKKFFLNNCKGPAALVLLCLLLSWTSGCGRVEPADPKAPPSAQAASKDAASAASGLAAGERVSFTDALGYQVAPVSCRRVVSLYGSFAETWTLAGGTLVGTTEDAVTERQMNLGQEVAVVGTVKSPNLENILALMPDFVILSADIPAQVKLHQNLQAAGIAHAYFAGLTFQDYLAMLEDFCRLTGRQDLYRQNGLVVQERIKKVQAAVQAVQQKQKNPPRVLLLRAYAHGVKVKNSHSLTGAMLQDLGAHNLADGEGGALEDLSMEEIIAADPAYILVVPMGEEQLAKAWLEKKFQDDPAWAGLTAVKNQHFYLLPKKLFHYKPNAKWGDSYAYLAKLLYPELETAI
jgi:iron complex transport system substrate-binding protein